MEPLAGELGYSAEPGVQAPRGYPGFRVQEAGSAYHLAPLLRLSLSRSPALPLRRAPHLCAILVPFFDHIEPACEASLRELEKRGYQVWRVPGYKQIDLARNQMASDALAAGCKETLWIDADTGFHPDAIERLRSQDLPIVCGIYPKKAKRELAIHALPGTKEIVFGAAGGLVELLYGPTGFLLVRREVYESMQTRLSCPSASPTPAERSFPISRR